MIGPIITERIPPLGLAYLSLPISDLIVGLQVAESPHHSP